MEAVEHSSAERVAQSQNEVFDPRQAYATPPVISQLVVKVASRCNIDCSYCYWFRDPSVYRRPKLMSQSVANQLLARVREHILQYSLSEFAMVLHGGEPLLWGRTNFNLFADGCRQISEEIGCRIDLLVTTNGVLIDEDWVDCFQNNNIRVTISLDGPAHIHDANRKTFQGGPTHALVERGIRLLQSKNVSFGALAVCNPAHLAKEYVDYFASIGVTGYDLLAPDATFEDAPAGIGIFYRDLFDLWLAANQKERTLSVRAVEAMVSGLVGGYSCSDGIGYGPEEICTILADGSIEALDVLRIAGDSSTRTTYNVFENAIQDIVNEPSWKAARDASLDLCDKCKTCKFMMACGGGYLPHRYSKENGYDNPSVYCDDLYSTFEYILNIVQNHVYISKPAGERVSVGEAIRLSGNRPTSLPANAR